MSLLNERALEVFRHWQQVMGKSRAKFKDDRKRKIMARLGDGYTVEDCKQAIDGCRASKWHMDNDQNGFVTIFRNAERLESLRDRIRPSPAADHDDSHYLDADTDS